jgi:hypothetical protein
MGVEVWPFPPLHGLPCDEAPRLFVNRGFRRLDSLARSRREELPVPRSSLISGDDCGGEGRRPRRDPGDAGASLDYLVESLEAVGRKDAPLRTYRPVDARAPAALIRSQNGK